jgi:hypothetical protein
MQIDKSMILGLLQERGQTEQAEQAQRELPDQVDTDRDAGMLEKFGLSPQDLLGRLGGGGGGIPGL